MNLTPCKGAAECGSVSLSRELSYNHRNSALDRILDWFLDWMLDRILDQILDRFLDGILDRIFCQRNFLNTASYVLNESQLCSEENPW